MEPWYVGPTITRGPSDPPGSHWERPPSDPDLAPAFTPAQLAYVRSKAQPHMTAALRKGMVSGLLLGATLTIIVLWALGLGQCP